MSSDEVELVESELVEGEFVEYGFTVEEIVKMGFDWSGVTHYLVKWEDFDR